MKLIQQLKSAWYKKQLTRPEFNELFAPAQPNQWVAIDCEMTGLDSKKNHLLSIAAVQIDGNVINTSNAVSLICRPPIMPDEDTIIIHGLRPVDVEKGVDYEKMLSILLPYIANRPIVGFCPQIDMAFLNPLVKKYMGTPLMNDVIDVRQLYNRYCGNRTQGIPHHSQRLDTICQAFNIPDLGAHDAYNDAVMTAMAFLHLRK